MAEMAHCSGGGDRTRNEAPVLQYRGAHDGLSPKWWWWVERVQQAAARAMATGLARARGPRNYNYARRQFTALARVKSVGVNILKTVVCAAAHRTTKNISPHQQRLQSVFAIPRAVCCVQIPPRLSA